MYSPFPAPLEAWESKFFTSLGLSAPPDFWKKSVLERPTDGQEAECQTSAWDFYTGDDFRIKKYTEVTIGDLLSIFHQMGHNQYFLQCQNPPVIFHEEEEINFLLGIALEKIAFIPFSYLVDVFRWKVFDGTIQKHIYNQEWWKLRLKHQGLWPPVPRTEDDFDPGAKFHVSASVPYIRYFLSLVLQFQLHKALCNASGHVGPLHQCDISSSKMAGKILGNALKLGSSRPWPEVPKELTGQSNMSTKAPIKPLLNWLVAENVRQGEILGWPDFTCSFEERTNKVDLLGLLLKPGQVTFGQWVLLFLSFVMFLVVLGLAYRLYFLEKWSLDQDSMILSSLPSTYFLGVAMEPQQATRRQWILLGLCFILMLCVISITIWIFTYHHRKPPWMRAEW